MFLVSSITKLFTATAVFQLIEEGKLHTDDKITDLLPEFRMKDERYRNIRISHLLTHTSGLPWDVILKIRPMMPLLCLYCCRSYKGRNSRSHPEKRYPTRRTAMLPLICWAWWWKARPACRSRSMSPRILQPLDMQRSAYFYETIDSTALAIPQVVSGNSRRVTRLNQYGSDSERNPVMNSEPLLVESYPVYGESMNTTAAATSFPMP